MVVIVQYQTHCDNGRETRRMWKYSENVAASIALVRTTTTLSHRIHRANVELCRLGQFTIWEKRNCWRYFSFLLLFLFKAALKSPIYYSFSNSKICVCVPYQHSLLVNSLFLRPTFSLLSSSLPCNLIFRGFSCRKERYLEFAAFWVSSLSSISRFQSNPEAIDGSLCQWCFLIFERNRRPRHHFEAEIQNQMIENRFHFHESETTSDAVSRSDAERHISVGIDVSTIRLAEAIGIKLFWICKVFRIVMERVNWDDNHCVLGKVEQRAIVHFQVVVLHTDPLCRLNQREREREEMRWDYNMQLSHISPSAMMAAHTQKVSHPQHRPMAKSFRDNLIQIF